MQQAPFVLIEGSAITAVEAGAPPPENAEIVDLPDTTLPAGLIDTHVHPTFDASPHPVAGLAARDDDAARTAMSVAARTAQAGGVTTVRDLGDRGYLSLGLRDWDGLPTIMAAGPPSTTVGGHCSGGCDLIRVMSSGGTLTRPGPARRRHSSGVRCSSRR